MATAQTVDQWFAKIKKWVPSWWFQNAFNMSVAVTEAIFYGAAAIYNQIEQDMLDQQASTFYIGSPGPIIDLLGDERSIARGLGQSDSDYDTTVRNSLFRNVGENILQLQIDLQLNNGNALLIENEQSGFYDDPDISETPGFLYYDDQWSVWLSGRKNYNWWTVIIPIQTAGVISSIAAAVVAAIQSNKALGTTYDIIFNTTDFVENEDGSYTLNEDGSKVITELQ